VAKTCFIMMPFGDSYLNQYYREIVKPAVEELGIEVVRADDIYGVRSVIEDIFCGIKNADILIADVTGKNPNVNYELGAAHMLNKDVIIIAQSMEDVPFDYKHRRIITYDTKNVNFAQKLKHAVQKTIRALDVIDVVTDIEEGEDEESFVFPINDVRCTITDTFNPSEAVLKGEGNFVHLSVRDGTIDAWDKNAAKHILRKTLDISSNLSGAEKLMLRRVFYDCQPCVTAFLDYIVDYGATPAFAKSELEYFFEDELDGIIFNAQVRVISANFNHDRFNPSNKGYYKEVFHGDSALGELFDEKSRTITGDCIVAAETMEPHVLHKDNDGYYTCTIEKHYPPDRNYKHTFYKIKGLLPLSGLGENREYAENESHWLAIWYNKVDSKEILLYPDQTIKFKFGKGGIGVLRDFPHAKNCRDITADDVIIM